MSTPDPRGGKPTPAGSPAASTDGGEQTLAEPLTTQGGTTQGGKPTPADEPKSTS
jgi:hypothetical protein